MTHTIELGLDKRSEMSRSTGTAGHWRRQTRSCWLSSGEARSGSPDTHFEREAGPDGALFVGSPETVAAKIAATVKVPRSLALRPQIQQRHVAARHADDEHRAVWDQGRADGARAT